MFTEVPFRTAPLRRAAWCCALAVVALISRLPARADPGDRDPAFDARLAPGEHPIDAALAADGSVYVLTETPRYSGVTVPLAIRFLPDGRRDPGFRAPAHRDPSYEPQAVQVDADGALYWSAWSRAAAPPKDRGLLERLRPDGGPDPGFDTRGKFASVGAFRLEARGSVLVQGTRTGSATVSLVRLSATGEVTAEILGFPKGGWCTFKAMVERPGNRLLVAGQIDCAQLPGRHGLAQLLEDGSLDPDFVPDPVRTVWSQVPNVWCAATGMEDQVWVGGLFQRVADHTSANVARLSKSGRVDRSFQVRSIDGDVNQVWPCPDGSALIVGGFSHVDGMHRDRLARLRADGSLDSGYVADLPPDPTVRIAGLRENGAALVAGSSIRSGKREGFVALLQGGASDNVKPRILRDATGGNTRVGSSHNLDPIVRCPPGSALQWYQNGAALPGATNAHLAFPDLHIAHNGVYSLRIAATNQVLVGPPVQLVVEPTLALAGWPDLTVDFGGGPVGAGTYVGVLVPLSGERMVVAGFFRRFGNKPAGSLVVLDAKGGIDPKTADAVFATFRVSVVRTNRDGRIMVGGSGWFRSPGGAARVGIARLLPDFRVDPTFDAELPTHADVRDIVELADGGYLVLARFLVSGSAEPLTLARLGTDGRPDAHAPEFLGSDESIRELIPLGDQRLCVVTTVGSEDFSSRLRVRYLLPSGWVDPSIASVFLPENSFPRFAAFGDHSVAVVGSFRHVDASGTTYQDTMILENGKERPLYEGPARELTGRPTGDLQRIARDREGRFLLGGPFGVRRLAGGRLDPGFAIRSDNGIGPIVPDASGGIYIGGTFNTVWGVRRPRLARVYAEDHFQPYLVGPFRSERGLQLKLETHEGWLYELEVAEEASPESWSSAGSFVGKGGEQVLQDGDAPGAHRFYRIRVHLPPGGAPR